MHVSSSSWIMVRAPLLSCFWGCYTEKRGLGTMRWADTPPLFSFGGEGWPVNQVRCVRHVIAVPANLGWSSGVPLKKSDWNLKEVSNRQNNDNKKRRSSATVVNNMRKNIFFNLPVCVCVCVYMAEDRRCGCMVPWLK